MKNSIKISLFLLISVSILFAAGFVFACNYHAYKDCFGNAIYWYDSCSGRQELYQDCASINQVCQYGQCVNYIPSSTPSSYIAHYTVACRGNNVYWYDSLGVSSGLYKVCADKNSCTLDICYSGQCSNVLKCDGSTCAKESADYNTYCQTQPVQQQTNQPQSANFLAFFSAKETLNDSQWSKGIQIKQNSTYYFLITINNNSNSQINNINVKVSIPEEIYMLGNLKINDAAVAGDIAAGINIESLFSGEIKSITFEGKTQTFNSQEQKQANVTVSVEGANQSDSIILDFNSSQNDDGVVSAVSSAPLSQKFSEFLKRWYLWIFGVIFLIFLFVIIFRRVSGNG